MAEIKDMEEKEAKFFQLSVLGVLASRKDIEQEYKIDGSLDKGHTIEEFFIEKESIEKTQLDNWKEKYQAEIKRIRDSASESRKIGFGGRKEYLNWYLQVPKKCCYCGVEESKLHVYFNDSNPQYIEARQRGKFLEIERIKTAPKSDNLYSQYNCALACYVCNNAKSDFISPNKFKPIAKGIHQFWLDLGIKVDFPEKSDIWNVN